MPVKRIRLERGKFKLIATSALGKTIELDSDSLEANLAIESGEDVDHDAYEFETEIEEEGDR